MKGKVLIDALMHDTRVSELCVIRLDGWIRATCWIDREDIFLIPNDLCNKKVRSHAWGYLPIVNENGAEIKIPCHYIDL